MSESRTSFDFSERTFLVTGASRGIGAATARLLGRGGASVGVNYNKSESEARAVSEAIEEAGGEAALVGADLSAPEGAGRAVDGTMEAFGELDGIVYCAGICRPALLEDLEDAAIDDVLETNLAGAIRTARAAVPHLRDAGSSDVVFVSSIAAQSGTVDAAYAASKAGLLGVARQLARELGGDGICVNAISPGPVSTDMGDEILEFLEEIEFRGHGDLDTFLEEYDATPDQVAGGIAYLLDAEFVTGETLTLNGGMYLD